MRVSSISRGGWCRCTYLKTEHKISEFLKYAGVSFTRQATLAGVRNVRRMSYDFCVDDAVMIELDGEQHFKRVVHWNSDPVACRRNDVFKMRGALAAEKSMIRLLQDDVWTDKYEWETELIDNLERMLNNHRAGLPCEIIYMCKHDEYAAHMADINSGDDSSAVVELPSDEESDVASDDDEI
jgi:hypothetical protein